MYITQHERKKKADKPDLYGTLLLSKFLDYIIDSGDPFQIGLISRAKCGFAAQVTTSPFQVEEFKDLNTYICSKE
jgi:hypothetical protein